MLMYNKIELKHSLNTVMHLYIKGMINKAQKGTFLNYAQNQYFCISMFYSAGKFVQSCWHDFFVFLAGKLRIKPFDKFKYLSGLK